MTSDRPYRPAMTRDSVLEFINDASGRAYDPDIVDAFVGLDPVMTGPALKGASRAH
jgi:HD-GYP domain-containing protein (c-di-GMP phosphodiesterase class II)